MTRGRERTRRPRPLTGLIASGCRTITRPATESSPAFPLRYVRTGPPSRTPVLVVPGGPGLGSVLPYRSLRRRAASRGLDVIMVEHRGVGLSRFDEKGRDLPTDAMWIEAVVGDLAAVLDAEAVDRAFLVGSSYGSHLVGCLGARHPDRVAGMLMDSMLLSPTIDLAIERREVRALFWDADNAIAAAVRELVARGTDQRRLLDVVRAAHELGGPSLLAPLLRQRLRAGRHPVWAALEAYATRDGSLSRIPGYYEFDLVGAIAFRELRYGAPPDALPMDPALTYAPVAARFPRFVGEAYLLPTIMAGFSWPMVFLAGSRDLRTPPDIARAAAEAARDAVLVEIDNGHSALETHPEALLYALGRLMSGSTRQLASESATLDALPRRGLAARLPELLGAGVRLLGPLG